MMPKLAYDKVSDLDVTDLKRANALANLENLQAKYNTAVYNLAYLEGNPRQMRLHRRMRGWLKPRLSLRRPGSVEPCQGWTERRR